MSRLSSGILNVDCAATPLTPLSLFSFVLADFKLRTIKKYPPSTLPLHAYSTIICVNGQLIFLNETIVSSNEESHFQNQSASKQRSKDDSKDWKIDQKWKRTVGVPPAPEIGERLFYFNWEWRLGDWEIGIEKNPKRKIQLLCPAQPMICYTT